MSKHTPGPWRFDESTTEILNDDDLCIAEMANWHPPSLVEARANARLIAAAPELLQALKGMLDKFSWSCPQVDAAREAIAKAEAT